MALKTGRVTVNLVESVRNGSMFVLPEENLQHPVEITQSVGQVDIFALSNSVGSGRYHF